MKFSSATNTRGFEPIDLTIRIESEKELESIEDFLGFNISIPDHYIAISNISDRKEHTKNVSEFMTGLHRLLQELRDAGKI